MDNEFFVMLANRPVSGEILMIIHPLSALNGRGNADLSTDLPEVRRPACPSQKAPYTAGNEENI